MCPARAAFFSARNACRRERTDPHLNRYFSGVKNMTITFRHRLVVAAFFLGLAGSGASADTVTQVTPATSPLNDGTINITFTPDASSLWYSADSPANQGDATVLAWAEAQSGADLARLFKCDGTDCGSPGSKSGGDGKAPADAITISSSAAAFSYLYIHSGHGRSSVRSWLFELDNPVTSFTLSGLPKGYSNASAFTVVPLPAAA